MKKLSLGLFVILCVGSLLFSGWQMEADAKEQVSLFKYANTQSPNHPRTKSMFFFKDHLEKASNGRIKVEIYHSGVLGKEAEVLDMVKIGTVQGCRGGLFERANKKFLLYTLPFLFEDAEQVLKVIRSPMGEEINREALKNGFHIPATGVAGGFRNITSNIKPIQTPADLKGLKMRTPPIDMALKTGVVDAQENPFSNTTDMKFYEVQKYLSVVNWQLHPDPFYVSPAWYNGLSDDLKAVFDAIARATLIYSDTIWLNSENGYFYFLKDKLKTNEISSEDRKLFVEKVKPVWQYYVDEGFFTWDDINKAISIAQEK
jgi:TRAP-type C4-dicarboxylate transport system substrate-binding protein